MGVVDAYVNCCVRWSGCYNHIQIDLLDGVDVTYVNWYSGEADSSDGCVNIKSSGRWERSRCTNSKQFICEKGSNVININNNNNNDKNDNNNNDKDYNIANNKYKQNKFIITNIN